MELKDQLQQLGLSDKEAKIFLACLEMGMATAYQIAGKAKIKRTTAYAVLDQLMEKKLVSYILKKDKKLFTAINPRKIIEIWQGREAEINKQQNLILDMVPYLESIYNKSTRKPKIRFFEGQEGLQNVYDDIVKDKVKVVYFMGTVEYSEELLGKEFLKDWVKRRVKAGIKGVGIRNKSKEIPDKIYTDKEDFLRDYRFAPSWVNLPMGVNIFGDKVAIISSKKESFGFVVESQEFALLMKSLFDVLWNISGEV